MRTKHIRSSFDISPEATEKLVSVLNSRLTGLTADMITLPIIMEAEREMGEYDYLIGPVIKGIFESVGTIGSGEIQVEGVNRLLSYPDYYDNDRLSELLGLFEHKDSLKKLLPSSLPSADQKDGGVQVYIGSENSVKIMDRSALVFKTVTENGKPIGAIGVIGPTRMDYGRVISVLDRLSEGIGDVISGDGGGDSSPDEKKGET